MTIFFSLDGSNECLIDVPLNEDAVFGLTLSVEKCYNDTKYKVLYVQLT